MELWKRLAVYFKLLSRRRNDYAIICQETQENIYFNATETQYPRQNQH